MKPREEGFLSELLELGGLYRIPFLLASPKPQAQGKRLFKKRAVVLANKVARKECMVKNCVVAQMKRFCKIRKAIRNGPRSFYDHIQSRSHRARVENEKNPFFCVPCTRIFESHHRVYRHRNSDAHLRVEIELIEKLIFCFVTSI